MAAWDAVFSFIRTVIGAPAPSQRTEAIVLNRWTANTMGPIDACAFIRQAFGVLYRHLSAVDLKKRRFTWEFAFDFERLMLAFRDAGLRYGQRILRFHNSRHYSGAHRTPSLKRRARSGPSL